MASALGQHHPADGGTLGTALINTIATTAAAAAYLAVHGTSAAARSAGAIHGYTTAFTFSAIVMAVAALTAFTLVRKGRPETGTEVVEAHGEGTTG